MALATFAQILGGLVINTLIVDSAIDHSLWSTGYDAFIDITAITPQPGVGWAYAGGVFSAPAQTLQAAIATRLTKGIIVGGLRVPCQPTDLALNNSLFNEVMAAYLISGQSASAFGALLLSALTPAKSVIDINNVPQSNISVSTFLSGFNTYFNTVKNIQYATSIAGIPA